MTTTRLTAEEIEKFAANEHDRWSRWHKYARANWIPERIARWDCLANTPYSDLSEDLKQKDRDEVRPYLDALEAAYREIDRLNTHIVATVVGLERDQLKAQIEKMWVNIGWAVVIEKDAEIERLKALLQQAEDAMRDIANDSGGPTSSREHTELLSLRHIVRKVNQRAVAFLSSFKKFREGKP